MKIVMYILVGLVFIFNKNSPLYKGFVCRGRWCTVKKLSRFYYCVKVFNRHNHLIGVRYILQGFNLKKEVNEAVESILFSGKCY